METIFTVRALLPHNCFMVSLDLRDAYLHVPIAEASQRFLRLAVDVGGTTVHLQFQALPFGLFSSPRIFTKVLAEVMAFLRLQGISVIAYLDDLLLFAACPVQLVKGLGWLLNLEKSSLIPSQRITYLGNLLDSTLLRVFLPAEKVLQKGATGPPCSGAVGQLVRHGLCKQTGRHEKRSPFGLSIRHSELGRDPHSLTLSSLPERRKECDSRLSQPNQAERGQLDPQPGGFQSHFREMGSSRSRSVRVKKQCESPMFFLPKQRRGSTGGRRIDPELAFQNLLCLPAPGVIARTSQEVPDGKHVPDSSSTTLAKEGLVLSTQAASGQTSLIPATSRGPPLTGPSPLSTGTPMAVSGLATEEGILRSKGFSEKLISTLLNSRKKETRQIYKKVWVRFNEWCVEGSFAVHSPTAVLEFLQCGADRGLSISTLKGQVSALSAYLEKHLATNPGGGQIL
ncbi:uncharacterized protein [Aquarana catesbeiana]|uniref:uncharacterized protein n=1 Tax=Aquarana catesbeiana TaxID=8400 RepID=UPI003CCA4478